MQGPHVEPSKYETNSNSPYTCILTNPLILTTTKGLNNLKYQASNELTLQLPPTHYPGNDKINLAADPSSVILSPLTLKAYSLICRCSPCRCLISVHPKIL